MAKIKIVPNDEGIQALLKSGEMEHIISGITSRIASRAGRGYASDVKMMGQRVISSAYTATEDAMKDCAENDTLLKELHDD